MMDLAIVNRTLVTTRGGAKTWALNIAERLEEFGIDVTFYVGVPIGSGSTEPIEGFDVVRIPTPHLVDLALAAPIGVGGALEELDALVFRNRVARVLHDAGHEVVQFDMDPRFGPLAKRLNAQTGIVQHGLPQSLFYDRIPSTRSSYDFFDSFDTVITTGVTAELIDRRTDSDVHTVNPGVETDRFSPLDESSREDGVTVLFVGRFAPVKNIPLLIDAFADICDKYPGAELVLVGDGPRRGRVERRITERGIEDRVELRGSVSHEEVHRVYHDADIFVLPSKMETFGMAVLEAMSCGVPVVTSDAGWLPNLVTDGETGFVFENGSRVELADALEALLSDAERRESFGQAARECATSMYSWDEQAARVAEIYQNLHSD